MLKRKLPEQSERAPMQPPPPGEIVDMEPHEMSAVDYGANDAPFLTLKEAGVKSPQSLTESITKSIMDGFKQMAELFKNQRSDENAMNTKQENANTEAPEVVAAAVAKMDDGDWERVSEYVKAECSKMITPIEERLKMCEEKMGQSADKAAEVQAQVETNAQETAEAVASVAKSFEDKLELMVGAFQKALNVTPAPNAQPGVTPAPIKTESQKSAWPLGINRAIASAAKR